MGLLNRFLILLAMELTTVPLAGSAKAEDDCMTRFSNFADQKACLLEEADAMYQTVQQQISDAQAKKAAHIERLQELDERKNEIDERLQEIDERLQEIDSAIGPTQ